MGRYETFAVRSVGCAFCLVFVTSWVSNVWSQPNPVVSAGEDGVAVEGLRAFDAGRYEEAQLKLERALELRGVPALALYAARTNVQLGQWVRASEWYLLAMRHQEPLGSEIAQLQVEHEAERERDALLLRMPRITVGLDGQDLDGVVVTLDSEPISSALLGACQLVDPGHHLVRATRGNQAITGEIEVFEGEHKTVTLSFARRTGTNAFEHTLPTLSTRTESVAVILPRVEGVVARSSPISVESTRNETQVAAGWVSLGLGATSTLVGIIAGISVLSARADLTGDCVNHRCDPSRANDVERYNRLRSWSTGGFIVGTAFAGAGLALVLTSSRKKTDPALAFYVGPNSAAFVHPF